MSSTRRQTEPGPLRQERFASSQEFKRGLLANLVAKRCGILERAADRDLVWFLQFVSHQPGGLNKLAADLQRRFPERIATDSMQRFGAKKGQVYSTGKVKVVRAEIPDGEALFPLRSDQNTVILSAKSLLGESEFTCHDDDPVNYAAVRFVEFCRDQAAKHLADFLARFCLDPAIDFETGAPWYFPTLISTLRKMQTEWIEARQPAAVTSIGKQVHEALDYASHSRRLVVVDGLPRIGKSRAAEDWCAQRPGRARLVQCPSSNDDYTFFRDIAASLGLSINLNSKAKDLRNRIEETLQSGDLTLVIDEAHYLWPQSSDLRHCSTPARVNWLMTALVNFAVPVALITTPQFFALQKVVERKTCWTSAQFTGRIGHYEKLPDVVTRKDMAAVARAWMPGASDDSIEALVIYANNSQKYLAGIRDVADRAAYMVQKAGRSKVELRDVMLAIDKSVVPSDTAFANAMKSVATPARKRAVAVSATPLQSDFNPLQRGTVAAPSPVRRRGNLGPVETEEPDESPTNRAVLANLATVE